MLKELIEIVGRAGADDAVAERVYRDREFRAELRTAPDLALATFTSRALTMAPLREIPASWRLRTEPRRTRTAA